MESLIVSLYRVIVGKLTNKLILYMLEIFPDKKNKMILLINL